MTEKLTFLEKVALERAEIVRLIHTTKIAAMPNSGLPQDVDKKVRVLLSEMRIEEAQQVVMDYLGAIAPKI